MAFSTFKTILENKLDHFYEVTTFSENKKEEEEEINLSIMNPYHIFIEKPSLTLWSIKTLIKQLARVVKAYIQVNQFDQFPIQPITRE